MQCYFQNGSIKNIGNVKNQGLSNILITWPFRVWSGSQFSFQNTEPTFDAKITEHFANHGAGLVILMLIKINNLFKKELTVK